MLKLTQAATTESRPETQARGRSGAGEGLASSPALRCPPCVHHLRISLALTYRDIRDMRDTSAGVPLSPFGSAPERSRRAGRASARPGRQPPAASASAFRLPISAFRFPTSDFSLPPSHPASPASVHSDGMSLHSSCARPGRQRFLLPPSDFRLPIPLHFVQTGRQRFRLPTSHFRFPISAFRLPTSDFRLPTSHFRLPISAFRLPTSDFRLPSSHFRLPISHFRLPTSAFPNFNIPCP